MTVAQAVAAYKAADAAYYEQRIDEDAWWAAWAALVRAVGTADAAIVTRPRRRVPARRPAGAWWRAVVRWLNGEPA